MKRIITCFLATLVLAQIGAISLEESIGLARQNNRKLLMAKEDVLMADQTYNEVRGTLLPQLNLVGGYTLSKTYLPDSAKIPAMNFAAGLDTLATRNDYYLAGVVSGIYNGMLPSSPIDEGSIAAQLQFSQVLFLGGKLVNGIRAADRYRSIQRLQYQLADQEMVVTTTQLFYACLLADKLTVVQQEALDTARRHLSRMEAFNAEGQVSEFDLLRARLEVAKLEPQLLQARNNYELALSAFQKQIGSPDAVPEGEFLLPPPLQLSLEEAEAQGLENRLEIELADIATEVARIKWNAEKGNYLPNVFLQANASLYTAADEFAIEKDDFGTSYSIGIGVQLPLFTGLSNSSKRRNAEHAWRKARFQQNEYEDLIRLQITQDYQKLQHALENYRVQEENIRLAERSLVLAQVRYENQVGIQLEVFDAQTMLSAIKLQYFQSIYEVISANQNLQRSIGISL
ncbi:MAG TPA: TolC family protein [Candidatus Cloacimonadota bacterium]|jgi:outer membrane protein TolC|nr:TolC family protein [Candidatus Cloacimonadota bacterium]HOF59389.1 TolC family protein [Candidatus Cloacimonadota bacterium]HOR58539.1 TolC family protein [Candidatus Cloacimonadota bacterium]HPB09012.1 TolC family protein [Candidatus Cloacimonadota bacterium]HQL12772.1 TolC family protein [Candidatus Cloacimonadota bacterium]